VHVLPTVAAEDSPMECVQEAGDVIFVPRHWGHAVLNLQTTIGYALEFPTVWRY
jgi:oxalate decarboxylase/phosphoglucose isomerase-like protein (cupin superfamily)